MCHRVGMASGKWWREWKSASTTSTLAPVTKPRWRGKLRGSALWFLRENSSWRCLNQRHRFCHHRRPGLRRLKGRQKHHHCQPTIDRSIYAILFKKKEGEIKTFSDKNTKAIFNSSGRNVIQIRTWSQRFKKEWRPMTKLSMRLKIQTNTWLYKTILFCVI